MSTPTIAQLRQARYSRVRVGERWRQWSSYREALVVQVKGDDPFYALVRFDDGNENWIPFTGILARWKKIIP